MFLKTSITLYLIILHLSSLVGLLSGEHIYWKNEKELPLKSIEAAQNIVFHANFQDILYGFIKNVQQRYYLKKIKSEFDKIKETE